MHPSLAQVHDRIELQKSALPQMYGDVDFTQTPERYTQDVAESSLPPSLHNMAPPPADMVARVKAYTMLGDVTADAYAALMGEYGFRRLVDMLTTACDEGLEAVPDAPPELVALITEMETRPDWLDMGIATRPIAGRLARTGQNALLQSRPHPWTRSKGSVRRGRKLCFTISDRPRAFRARRSPT